VNQPTPYPPPPVPTSPPSPPRRGRFIAWTVAAAAAAFALGGLVASQGGDGGGPVANPAACKKAMAVDFEKAMADPGGPTSGAPGSCVGLDEATLERIMGEVISEYTASPAAEKAFEEQVRKALESATATP
jgi:hypothetical protein